MQVDLIKTIQKLMSSHNLPTTRVAPPFEGLENFDYGLRKALDPVFDWQDFGRVLLRAIPENTLMIAEGTFELRFAMFRMPDEEEAAYICGPWTTGHRDPKTMRHIKGMIGEQGAAAVQEYYNGVQVLDENWLVSTLSALLSMVYRPDDFKVLQTREFLPLHFTPDTRYFNEPPFQQEIPAAMIEQRYAGENRLLEAVARGDVDTAMSIMRQNARFEIDGRFSGNLWQVKNKLLVMNTLFRKAIQTSMVHPYYIDKISARYSLEIENMTMEDDERMTINMVQEYCAYVRKYSLKDYSPLVQKVINHINLNLDTPLSLKSLAAMCFISPSYLSNLFKRETGTTLTDYINSQRIQRAAYMLSNTKLAVAVVAERVGILDVNYFTKVFKRAMSATPTQYRREHPAG